MTEIGPFVLSLALVAACTSVALCRSSTSRKNKTKKNVVTKGTASLPRNSHADETFDHLFEQLKAEAGQVLQAHPELAQVHAVTIEQLAQGAVDFVIALNSGRRGDEERFHLGKAFMKLLVAGYGKQRSTDASTKWVPVDELE